MKNKINSFENFMKSRLFEAEKLEQAPEEWDQYFSDVKDQKQEAGQESSQGKEIPDWAKKGLSLDALKGKNADQRWEWLTNRVNTVLKDKQTTKVEELKGDNLGGIPGYRLLWKEGKTETGNQQDKSGNIYSVYYTELYKGNPGTWIDKKDEGGKPGAILGKGYWGQNSRIAKTTGGTGGTGASEGVSGGILWIDEPEKVAAKGGTGIGDMSLLDLFAKTEMGQAILTSIMGDSEILKKLKSDGKIDFTDSPPTVEDIDSEFTPEQKKVQEENIKKLKEMGQNVVRPDFKLVTSATDYNYKPSSLKMSWDEVKSALDSSGSSSKMDFGKWNIVGIRNSLAIKNQYQNRFTDLIVLMGPSDKKEIKIYPATTTPGIAFAYTPFRNWWMASALRDTINPDGVAILQPGVYEYQVGNHRGYKALVQASNSTVGRIEPVLEPSDLKFKTLQPSKKQTGSYGLNIHKALAGDTPSIDSWSAGCQVFKNGKDFGEFMDLISGKASQPKYSYALINSSDFGRKESLA